MNIPPRYPPARVAARSNAMLRWFFYLMLAGLLLLVLAVVGVTSYLRLGADTAALRDAAQETSRAEWRKIIAVNIGDATCLLARAGLSFAKIPEEPCAAIRALRACEVGVFESCGANSPDRGAMLTQADKAMSRRGWERVVGVMDGKDLVAVYVPRTMASPKRVRACILVLDGRQMVVVSAKGNLEPVIELALRRTDFCEQIPLLAKH
jgi:hypothetical protein